MTALVLGPAAPLPDDVREFTWLLATCGYGLEDLTVIAVNAAGTFYLDRIDHWASLHSKEFPEWRQRRADLGGNLDFTTWGAHPRHPVDRHIRHRGGSSGMLGAEVAFDLGADRIVLCGVPLDASPYVGTAEPWPWAEKYLPHWRARIDEIRERVRSMSGETRKLLGAPTREWLTLPVPTP